MIHAHGLGQPIAMNPRGERIYGLNKILIQYDRDIARIKKRTKIAYFRRP